MAKNIYIVRKVKKDKMGYTKVFLYNKGLFQCYTTRDKTIDRYSIVCIVNDSHVVRAKV